MSTSLISCVTTVTHILSLLAGLVTALMVPLRSHKIAFESIFPPSFVLDLQHPHHLHHINRGLSSVVLQSLSIFF